MSNASDKRDPSDFVGNMNQRPEDMPSDEELDVQVLPEDINEDGSIKPRIPYSFEPKNMAEFGGSDEEELEILEDYDSEGELLEEDDPDEKTEDDD